MGKFDHIPELTGASTFHVWMSQVVLALGHEGVYNHVSDGLDLSYPYFYQSQLQSNLGLPDLSLGIDTTPDLVRPSPAP